MIYLIPKCFNKKKDFIEKCFEYLNSVNDLNIEFNPKKSIYPRLKKSKKRGKNAVIEILNELKPSFFSDEHRLMNELINILKWSLRKIEYKGIQVLAVTTSNAELLTEKYFPLNEWSHISETETDLLNSKINTMSQVLFNNICMEEETVETVKIITSHLSNYVISTEEKLEIIKYILNN
tara:strand:+ start:15501 stop:16037 length:537 start_codon:yes stop_codon:yes gene_type:complete